jgi:hypothetical protein
LRSRPEEGTIAVTEPQRLALHAAARAALGSEEGDTLMALTPPANTDMATRQDLAVALAGLRSDILERIDRTQWRIIGAMLLLNSAGVGIVFALARGA